MRQYKSSPLSCKKCKSRWILWVIRENVEKWKQITVGDCLTFPVNLQWFRVLAPCLAATEDCRLTHGINLDYRKTLLEIEKSSSKISIWRRAMKPRSSLWSMKTKTSHTSEDRLNQGTISMPTFATKPLTTSSICSAGGITAELHGRTAKTANIRIASRQIP